MPITERQPIYRPNSLVRVYDRTGNLLRLEYDNGKVYEGPEKIYRVHFKNGSSKLVAAKSARGLPGQYAQRVSPKGGGK